MGSLSSLEIIRCIYSYNNVTVEIQKQLKDLKNKSTSVTSAFFRGYSAVLGYEGAGYFTNTVTKHEIDIIVNILKSFYK